MRVLKAPCKAAGRPEPGHKGGRPGRMQPAPYAPQQSTSQSASDIEIGTLYAFSAGYGVGTGIWIDAELHIDDPGLQFLAPSILGLAARSASSFWIDRGCHAGCRPPWRPAWPSAPVRGWGSPATSSSPPSPTTSGGFADSRARSSSDRPPEPRRVRWPRTRWSLRPRPACCSAAAWRGAR